MARVEELLRETRETIGIFETRLLLALAMHVRVERLVAHPEEEVTPEAETAFRGYAARRLAGEPYPYIAGEQEFYGRSFRVTPDVLIPRPDTELIVELALEELKRFRRPTVLDMGTGSGCIAITVALENPKAEVWASDRSEAALEVARGNAGKSGVRFLQGSWYKALPPDAPKFDLILSNPPYIDPESPYLSDLTYEPQTALVSGNHGMDDLREIAEGAAAHLAPGGCLMVEHGFDQGEACRKVFTEAGLSDAETLKAELFVDQVEIQGIDAVVLIDEYDKPLLDVMDMFRSAAFGIRGGRGRNRTVDTRIFNPLLYRLSYPTTHRS